MSELRQLCTKFKKDFEPKKQDPAKPVRFWSEKDFLDDKIADAYVIIFRTRGCTWALKSGCSMCGYFNDSYWNKISDDDLLKQFETAMEKYSGEKFVKIFTSGSFLDDEEIKPKVRNEILSKLAKTANKISVESRSEYIADKKLSEIKKIVGNTIFEVGIGLETADDFVRENSINKGFTFDDYKKAAQVLKKYKFKVKTYVLIKPLFLSERKSIDDAIETVKKIKNLTDVISFNPTNVQKNTLVNYLWRRKQYRPAWLWSVVKILKESKKIIGKNVHIKCDVAGGGNIRGAHNCKNCNSVFLDKISEFSLSNDTKIFDDLQCECKEKWLDQIDIEDLGFGSVIDM